MEKRLDYERGLILLADSDNNQLTYRAGYGFTPEHEEILTKSPLPLDEHAPYGPILAAFFQQQPQHIADTEKIFTTLPPNSKMLVRELVIKSFLCCPIIFNNRSLGILAVDYANQEKQLIQSDINLLMGIAQVLGVRLHNATLLAEQVRQNQEILSLEKAHAVIAAEKEKSDRLAENLQEINDELKNFTYIVSHDLRAPLINIKGFSAELNTALEEIEAPLKKCREFLSDKETELLDIVLEEDIPEALEFINSSVTRMDGQINGILKLSRMGRRELLPEDVNLQEMVEAMIKTLAHQLDSHQAAVEIIGLPTIRADRISLEQIFGNLLDNGVKYLETGRPGKITVGCKQTDSEFIFSIKDNGQGIAEQDIEKIFAIFRRAGRQDTKGEGLGLASVKTLVRKLDGHIWCESTLGIGSTFFVALPRE